jgi:hypothetical protein
MISKKNTLLLVTLIFLLKPFVSAQNTTERLKLAISIEKAEKIFYNGAITRNAYCHITNSGQITEIDSTYSYYLTYNLKEIDLELTEIVELTDPDAVALLVRCKRNERCIQFRSFGKKERSYPSFEVFVSDGIEKDSLNQLLFQLKEIQLIILNGM